MQGNPNRTNRRAVSSLILALYFATCLPCAGEELQRYVLERPKLGSIVRLAFYAADSSIANQAAEATFDRIDQLDRILSNYRSDSELLRLCALTQIGATSTGQSPELPIAETVSRDLWRVLRSAQRHSRLTDGAFDVTVGPLSRLWKRAIRRRELPSVHQIEQARRQVGYQFVEVAVDEPLVTLHRPNLRLDLGGIAKGYIADQALRVLNDHGIAHAIVDAGGDIAVGAQPPGRSGWDIAISRGHPDRVPAVRDQVRKEVAPSARIRIVRLANCGIATSGDTFQSAEINGRRYSHTVDPRTGQGIDQPATVTVIAKTAMQADALASSISVLGMKAGLELAERLPETDAHVWYSAIGEGMGSESVRPPVQSRSKMTSGFGDRFVSPAFDGFSDP